MYDENRSRFGVTLEKSLRDLKKIRDMAVEEQRYSEAINAEKLRMQATGLLVNKAELENLQRKAQDRMKKATVTQINPKKIGKNS